MTRGTCTALVLRPKLTGRKCSEIQTVSVLLTISNFELQFECSKLKYKFCVYFSTVCLVLVKRLTFDRLSNKCLYVLQNLL